MDGQFHEVLRDFALEKMKEIESNESTNTEKRRANFRKAKCDTYSESSDDDYFAEKVMDSIKAISADNKEQTDDGKQKEKHSKRRHHHKHSKKESHHHKSKRKDKKHSSSSKHSSTSKHKRKHKRKSSSHRSREQKRKDHGKGESNRDSDKFEKGGKDSDKSELMGDGSKNEDSDSSSQIDTDEGDSDFEGRSVSPPLQLGKDELSEVFSLHSSDESPSGSPKNDAPIEQEENIINDAAANTLDRREKPCLEKEEAVKRKKSSSLLLSQTRNLILQISDEENDDEKVEKCHATSKLAMGEFFDIKGCHDGDRGLKIEETEDRFKLKQLRENLSKSSEGFQKEDEKGLPTGLVNKKAIIPDSETKDSCIGKETNIPVLPKNDESGVKAESKDQERNAKVERVSQGKGPIVKMQNKQQLIKINIKTLELPTDVSSTAEDKTKVEEDAGSDTSEDDEGGHDKNGGDATNPDRPWRIVPEEGELTPSSTSDEGKRTKEEPAAGSIEGSTEKGKEDGEGQEVKRKDRHRHGKKRRHAGTEDGEIVDKKKRQRHQDEKQDKNSDSKDKGESRVKLSVKDRLGVRKKSRSPERKSVRSSVVVRDNKSPKRRSGHSRSRSRSPSRRRSRSRSPHFSRYSSSSKGRNDRSRSRSPGHRRSDSPQGRRSYSYRDKHSSSRDRRQVDRSRSRSKERERRRRERSYTPVEEIDKKKLFEIAKANAYLYQKVMSGDLPANTKLPQLERKRVRLAGKTVDELTEVCKNLSKGDDEDSSDEEPVNVPVTSDDEKDSFIRHPFQVKERPLSIVLNIQNAIPIPVQNSKEKLRVQFPVSSGTQHRKKEESTGTGPYGEWEPVKIPQRVSAPGDTSSVPLAVAPPAGTLPSSSSAVNLPNPTPSLPTPLAPAVPAPMIPSAAVPVQDRVFEERPTDNVNIADVVAMRLKAARQLQTNPLDIEALSSMHKAQSRLQNWVNKDHKPGLFTGHTDATILTPLQLAHPDRKNQAWAKRDMFHNHMPVQGGIGMQLLQKMGWKQGEGLGRHKMGVTQPLLLDVKMDRKGLAVKPPRTMKMKMMVNRQKMRYQNPNPSPANMDLSGKHPVSVLNELCSKRKWKQPDYIMVHEQGPAHRKEFIFKVILNGEEFQGTVPCNNKKEAKAQAAGSALVKLGLIPNPSQTT